MEKEKRIRIAVLIILCAITLVLHLMPRPSYTTLYGRFFNSYIIDILLPAYLFILFTMQIYRLSFKFQNRPFQVKLIMAGIVLLIVFTIETLQYFHVPILGRTFDPVDYLMYFIGVLLGMLIDFIVVGVSKASYKIKSKVDDPHTDIIKPEQFMKPIRIPFVFIYTIIPSVLFAQQIQPKRPDDFQPYKYKHSIETLQNKYSQKMSHTAKKEMAELNRVNENGLYKATLESLDQHPTPEWYVDAKLGIFFDWGPYSVVGYGDKEWSRARYPDWYLNHMYHRHKDYHEKMWGKDFQRDDFIGLFTAENFNAEEIVKLSKQAGAKYIVPFNKHHDGFCLWDSKFTQRDVVDMIPGRDLTQDLVDACEKAGLYHGFYFSVEDYEYPLISENGNNLTVRLWSKRMAPDNAGAVEANGEFYTEFDPVFHNRILSGKIPVTHFIDEYIVPQAKDFIDRYNPDILWFDGEWQRPAEYYRTPDIVAYFYNQAEGKKDVVSNDRLGQGTREHHGDFYTSETDEVVSKMEYPWEENRSMSESYGYNWSDSLSNYVTPDELIQMLVRIVAKGGNLNLMVNPDGSGKIPDIQKNLLRELGEWLKINAEAIYNTRPYEVLCDNTQLGQPVWYTMSKDSSHAYAIIFDWPKSETFICTGANIKWDTEVILLGYDKPIKWVDTGRNAWALSAKIPEEMLTDESKRPCKHAWVLKFEYDKKNEFSN